MLGWASLTDAQTIKKFRRELSPEVKVTLDQLDKVVKLDLKEVAITDVANAISNQTGVLVRFAPELAAQVAAMPRISVTAENIPGHLVLMESLGSMKLGMKIEKDGVDVTPGGKERRFGIPESAEGEIELETEESDVMEHFILEEPDSEPDGPQSTPRVIVRREVRIEKNSADKPDTDRTVIMAHPGMEKRAKTVIHKDGEHVSEGKLQIKVHGKE